MIRFSSAMVVGWFWKSHPLRSFDWPVRRKWLSSVSNQKWSKRSGEKSCTLMPAFFSPYFVLFNEFVLEIDTKLTFVGHRLLFTAHKSLLLDIITQRYVKKKIVKTLRISSNQRRTSRLHKVSLSKKKKISFIFLCFEEYCSLCVLKNMAFSKPWKPRPLSMTDLRDWSKTQSLKSHFKT